MTFDLYAWKSPRDLDADGAEALLDSWQETGGDPSESPFEPSADVGWFYRELTKDAPDLEVLSDAVPNASKAPIWLSTTPEPPARVVQMRLSPETPGDVLESIFGLVMKYDLVLFDPRTRRVRLPFEEMAVYASAAFWPAGAIQASVAGVIGAVMFVVGYLLGIPLLSWVLELIGGFLFVMAVYTFIHEGRKAVKKRREERKPPPPASRRPTAP